MGTETTRAGDGQLVCKNTARLADGREIIYFDETPGLNRALARDLREGLAPVPAPGTWSPDQAVRWDPLLGEWVIIAAQRQERTFLPPPDQCPLDPSAPGRPTEVPADSYDVVVFENRFPSLRGASTIPGTGGPPHPPDPDDGMAPQRPGYGTRMVGANDHWTAFVPPAARWPYEVLIFPARRVPDLAALDDPARAAFGDLYLDVLRRFDRLLGTPAPYIAAWHQAPVTDAEARRQFGLHLQVFTVRRAPGKLKYLAGTESGMAVWANDIVPETAARRLREA